jgi:hypothetical protein
LAKLDASLRQGLIDFGNAHPAGFWQRGSRAHKAFMRFLKQAHLLRREFQGLTPFVKPINPRKKLLVEIGFGIESCQLGRDRLFDFLDFRRSVSRCQIEKGGRCARQQLTRALLSFDVGAVSALAIRAMSARASFSP